MLLKLVQNIQGWYNENDIVQVTLDDLQKKMVMNQRQ